MLSNLVEADQFRRSRHSQRRETHLLKRSLSPVTGCICIETPGGISCLILMLLNLPVPAGSRC